VFNSLTVHGDQAALVWGYRTTADLRAWRITRTKDGWILLATVTKSTTWEVRQAVRCNELLFTAPRARGRWCFPVLAVTEIGTYVSDILGPPQQ